LGLYDVNHVRDTKDEQQIKDFMVAKYEKKRYVFLDQFSSYLITLFVVCFVPLQGRIIWTGKIAVGTAEQLQKHQDTQFLDQDFSLNTLIQGVLKVFGLPYFAYFYANSTYITSKCIVFYISYLESRGSIVVKALCYKLEGLGFETR
jgi:hypothetical protein